jgi:hypothetical protein
MSSSSYEFYLFVYFCAAIFLLGPPFDPEIQEVAKGCFLPTAFMDRDRGEPRGSAPPTPPYVRVRIRRFEKSR